MQCSVMTGGVRCVRIGVVVKVKDEGRLKLRLTTGQDRAGQDKTGQWMG